MSVRARQIALDIVYKASRRKRRKLRLPPVKPDNKNLVRLEKLGEELLPGIDNEITLTHIVSRLPWKTLLVLLTVRRDWKQALSGGNRNFHQRVSSGSTETLAVVDVSGTTDDQSSAIALYSVTNKRLYYVPPVPGSEVSPDTYECVAMDGKLYVLGGRKNFWPLLLSKEVYVLDLLGQRQWRQCKNMIKPRHEFGCAVLDGKIYIFGGKSSRDKPVAGAEVYDPTLDSWSLIPYSGVARFRHRVSVVGEDLVLHGGKGLQDGGLIHFDPSSLVEFYNPITKEYRIVDVFNFRGMDIVSGAQGIFYSVRWEDMCAYAVDEHGTYDRVHLRSFSTEIVPPLHRDFLHRREGIAMLSYGEPFTVTAIDDELLAVVHWVNTRTRITGSFFVQSRGYSSENSQICWEEAPCSGKHSSPVIHRIKCSIQL